MNQIDKIKDWLFSLDPDVVCNLLDLSTEEIIYRFEDVIIRKQRFLEGEMYDPYEELNFD